MRPGDSLWAIAQQAYGDGRLWPVLPRDNTGMTGDPNLIFPGQRFEIPALPKEELRRLLQRLQSVAA